MPLITWNDNYAVHVREVDDQHQNLIAILNRLFDAMQIGKGKVILGSVLKELIDYTVYHFETEERLFRQYGYPEFEAHKKEHDDLTATAVNFRVEFEAGNKLISINLLSFLSEWLNNHILGSDKKFGPFLNSKGVY